MCEKICETCGNFHRTDNFDCEHWGDLPEDWCGHCGMWIEGELPHNILYRIRKLEEEVGI